MKHWCKVLAFTVAVLSLSVGSGSVLADSTGSAVASSSSGSVVSSSTSSVSSTGSDAGSSSSMTSSDSAVLSALQNQQSALQNKYNSENSSAQTIMNEVNQLTEKINTIQSQLVSLQSQVDTLQSQIQTNKAKITDLENRLASDKLIFASRLKAMYMNGNESFLDVLFDSNSLSDYISRNEAVLAVVRYTDSVKKRCLADEAQLQSEKSKLNAESTALTSAQTSLSIKQGYLNDAMNSQNAKLNTMFSQMNNTQQQLQTVTAQFEAEAAQMRAQVSVSTGYQVDTNFAVGVATLDASTLQYLPLVQKYANMYNMTQYINLIMAVIRQESDGSVPDIMQALPIGSTTATPEASVNAGVQELRDCIIKAGVTSPSDFANIDYALQGYNFGQGFISWARANGGYNLTNTVKFAQMECQLLGWKSYGDPYYVPHVLRYYTV